MKIVVIAVTFLISCTHFNTLGDCTLTNGANYPIPFGDTRPRLLAFSPDSSFLVTTNNNPSSLGSGSVFANNNGVLVGTDSYAAPGTPLVQGIAFDSSQDNFYITSE